MEDLEKILIDYFTTKNKKNTISIDTAFNLFMSFNSDIKRIDTIRFYKDHIKPFFRFCDMNNIKNLGRTYTIIPYSTNTQTAVGNKALINKFAVLRETSKNRFKQITEIITTKKITKFLFFILKLVILHELNRFSNTQSM